MSKPQKPLAETVKECLQSQIEVPASDTESKIDTKPEKAQKKPKRVYIRRQGHPELTDTEIDRLRKANTDIIEQAFNTSDVESNGIQYTVKDRLYLQAFLDPESPTYLDRNASYKRIYPESKVLNDRTVQQYTYHKLRRYRQSGLIAAYLSAIDMEIQRRLSWLKPIMTGTARKETLVYSRVVDKNTGIAEEVLTGRTVSAPSFQERIKAIDLINKMTGEYDKRRIEANEAGQQLKTLRKKAMDDMRKAREQARAATIKSDSDEHDDIEDAETEYDNAALLPAVQTEIYDTGM